MRPGTFELFETRSAFGEFLRNRGREPQHAENIIVFAFSYFGLALMAPISRRPGTQFREPLDSRYGALVVHLARYRYFVRIRGNWRGGMTKFFAHLACAAAPIF